MKPVAVQNERGFTLIEVLVALAILAVSLAAMMDGFSAASRGNAGVYRYNVALSLAQSKMEEIKNSPFISVTDTGPVFFNEESGYSEFAEYQYAVAATDNNLISKTVVVTVYYNDEGAPREVALTGEITRR